MNHIRHHYTGDKTSKKCSILGKFGPFKVNKHQVLGGPVPPLCTGFPGVRACLFASLRVRNLVEAEMTMTVKINSENKRSQSTLVAHKKAVNLS